MSAARVFVDANVLFSKTLCDWLFMLRVETRGELFVLLSSEDSITEALYHLRKSKPKADGAFTAQRRRLFREALDDIIDSFSGDVTFPGSDVNDHHVHAAAVDCRADYLVANDLGFRKIDRDELPYEVHTADSFLQLIADSAPAAVAAVMAKQIAHFADRLGARPLDDALVAAGCPAFAGRVRGLTLEEIRY